MLGTKLKYVIFNKNTPVIFHEVVAHNEIYGGRGKKATSAGFVSLVPISYGRKGFINSTVYGESISLGLKNNGDEDNEIIERFLND